LKSGGDEGDVFKLFDGVHGNYFQGLYHRQYSQPQQNSFLYYTHWCSALIVHISTVNQYRKTISHVFANLFIIVIAIKCEMLQPKTNKEINKEIYLQNNLSQCKLFLTLYKSNSKQ